MPSRRALPAIALLATGVGAPVSVLVGGAAVIDTINAAGAAAAAKEAMSNAMQMRGPGSESKVRSDQVDVPFRDVTGKVHGELPEYAPKEWTRDQLLNTKSELEQSVALSFGGTALPMPEAPALPAKG